MIRDTQAWATRQSFIPRDGGIPNPGIGQLLCENKHRCKECNMVRLSTTLILLLGFGAIPAAAQNGPCTKSEAIQADHEIDSLKDWDSIYRAYQKFSQCDDGS